MSYENAPSHLERIFNEAGYKGRHARQLAIAVSSTSRANRIKDMILLGQEHGIWRELGVNKPLNYIRELVLNAGSDPDGGLMPWFLHYEETGNIPGANKRKLQEQAKRRQRHLTFYKLLTRLDEFEAQTAETRIRFLELAKNCANDPVSKQNITSNTALTVLASALWHKHRKREEASEYELQNIAK